MNPGNRSDPRPDDLEVRPSDLRVGDRIVGFARCADEQPRRNTLHGEYPVVAVEDEYSFVTILGDRRPWMRMNDQTHRIWIRARGA